MKDVALRYRVIGVGREEGVLSQLEALFEGSSCEIYLVSQGRAAIEMVRTLGPFDLLAIELSCDRERLAGLLTELHRELAEPPRIAVLVAEEDGDVLSDLSSWDCTVLSFDRSLDQLAAELQELLERAPRVDARLMVRLEVGEDAERLLRLAQTENISKSGMLLRTDEDFPADASVRFELLFPEDPDPVRGRARVVRRVDPARERMTGVGVRFQTLLGSDQLRLERFLEHALADANAAPPGSASMAAAAS